ncbi:MAG: hypothetical protein KJN76_02305 [Eudoraea sp.]|nr:hypothetical protein [Eudoraea sp.]
MNRLWIFVVAILAISCNAQENKKENNNKEEISEATPPKGSWRVNREYDEAGNLIQYDSIYSWSSEDEFGNLSAMDQDSLLQSFHSKFFKHFRGSSAFNPKDFPGFFDNDSLIRERFFSEDFFDSEFGKDFMDIDRIHERMEKMQEQFLKRYQSRLRPLEKENSEEKEQI